MYLWMYHHFLTLTENFWSECIGIERYRRTVQMMINFRDVLQMGHGNVVQKANG